MPRKHLFPLVVLLAAIVVAGLLALTRTVELGQATRASTASDPSIAFRLKRLDRFETRLRKELAAEQKNRARQPAETTIYRRPPAVVVQSHRSGYEHEGEDEGRDD